MSQAAFILRGTEMTTSATHEPKLFYETLLELPASAVQVQDSARLFFETLPGFIGNMDRRSYYEITYFDCYIGIRQRYELTSHPLVPLSRAHNPEIEIRLTEISQQRTLARIAGATLPIGAELIAFWRELYGLSETGTAQSTNAAKPTSKKRKGGPIPTPHDVIDAILKEWDEVKGRESQENFCNRKGIGVSTLGAWQRKRKS
jgi:hypothetical protein